MQVPKLPPKSLLLINLVLGCFIGLANGGALLITASGGKSQLQGQIGEIALWTAAGVALAVLSLIGLRKAKTENWVLEAQTVMVFILIGALAAWGLTIASGSHALVGRVGWSAGFLSLLALYCYFQYASVSSIRGWARSLRLFVLLFLVACIAIDIAAFSVVMRS